ncbi:MAG TPA: hypothetical protein VFF29_07260 [Bacteroidota bacterium]|nr:hypothetical protein [Bacteroidota bacterium]
MLFIIKFSDGKYNGISKHRQNPLCSLGSCLPVRRTLAEGGLNLPARSVSAKAGDSFGKQAAVKEEFS